MAKKAKGPFDGKFPALENYQLAEIFILDKGHGYEFAKAEFREATGIKDRSILRVLQNLADKGIIAAYQHPKFRNQNMYRIAWPVIITKKGVVPEYDMETAYPKETRTAVAIERRPEVNTYRVLLGHPSEDGAVWVWEFGINAYSAQEAAEKARRGLRATVLQEWKDL